MDGIFDKWLFDRAMTIMGLIAGLFLTGLFGWLLFSGEFQTLDDRFLAGFFTCFGLFTMVFCGLSLAVNRKAFIHVDESGITAFCHYGLKLDCPLSQVSGVSYGGTGLTIRLANGKRYNLMHLENAVPLGNFIEKQLPSHTGDTLSPALLMEQIPPLRSKCRREGILAMVGFPLLIPLVFLTSGLTGWKELHQFTSRDWRVFGIFGTVGLLLMAVSCLSLRRYLLHSEQLHTIQGNLCQQLLRTAPLLPGKVLGLYLDDERHASFRLTVFGNPNKKDVYFTIEQVNRDFQLECIQKSGMIPHLRELEPELADLIPIPLPGELQR